MKNKKKTINLSTGQCWAKKLNIIITNPSGWISVSDFENNLINKEEFLNRATNSVLEPPFKSSRKEVSRFKKLLNK